MLCECPQQLCWLKCMYACMRLQFQCRSYVMMLKFQSVCLSYKCMYVCMHEVEISMPYSYVMMLKFQSGSVCLLYKCMYACKVEISMP